MPLQLVRLDFLDYSVSGFPVQNRCREMGKVQQNAARMDRVLKYIDLWMEMEVLGFVQFEKGQLSTL